MNTEFPSRIPTIKNSTNQNSTNTSASTETQNKTIDVLKEAIQVLKNLSDKVTDFINTKLIPSKKEESPKTEDKSKSRAPIVNVVSESVSTLKHLTQIVGDFFKSSIFHPFREDSDDKDEEEKTSSFRRFMKNGMSKLSKSWKDGIKNLQMSVESTSASIGSSIGRVFGSGIFGNLIGKIITKALNFAVSKVLIGLVVSNLPILAIIGGIIAAIYLVVKYADQIWESIKWLGYSIDQGLDAIIDALPWGKSKYEESRKEMAKKLNVSEEAILDYYGDTVRGRNQAYEDWKRMQTDSEFFYEMGQKIANKSGWVGKASITPETMENASETTKLIREIQFQIGDTSQDYYYGKSTPETDYLQLGDKKKEAPLMTPIFNSTVNNTALNTGFGLNVNSSTYYDPHLQGRSDNWIIGMNMPS